MDRSAVRMTAKKRLGHSGMPWQYDLIYRPASAFTHTSARAMASHIAVDDDGQLLDQQHRSAPLGLATEVMIRVLYLAEIVLDQGKDVFVDGYAASTRRSSFPVGALRR